MSYIKKQLNDEALLAWLIKDDYKQLKNLIKVNSVRGSIAERLLAEMFNSEFIDAYGSDEINPQGRLVETKITKSVNQGKFEVGNVLSKKDKCDIIRIVDLENYRIFEIPHDEFFKRAKIFKRGVKKISDSIFWSASYNTVDKIQRENTTLLLDFEVKY
tara:strand:- start:210 stop:686 length:477 start_codon:yes stop_codon:yes gene_type:complete